MLFKLTPHRVRRLNLYPITSMTQPFEIPFESDFEKSSLLAPPNQERDALKPAHPEEPSIQQLLNSPSYRIAFYDEEFLMSDYARAVRLQLEAIKPESVMRHYGVRSTVIVFGSARTISNDRATKNLRAAEAKWEMYKDDPNVRDELAVARRDHEMSRYYELAREFGKIVTEANKFPDPRGHYDYVICTGGGPGIMEAANRGAYEADGLSVGLNIQLPYEQRPNPYMTPQLCFQFHYFAIRKLHFMLRAKALVACPGGFGTFDELFEALTLRQTQRMQQIPIILFGEEFWRKTVNFDYLVETGVIDRKDLKLFHFTESPAEAWRTIRDFH